MAKSKLSHIFTKQVHVSWVQGFEKVCAGACL